MKLLKTKKNFKKFISASILTYFFVLTSNFRKIALNSSFIFFKNILEKKETTALLKNIFFLIFRRSTACIFRVPNMNDKMHVQNDKMKIKI